MAAVGGEPLTDWWFPVIGGLIGLLIVVAIVLFLAKVAIAGGIVGQITTLVVLVLFLMRR